VTAERKKKHIALKLPFEAGREILGSSQKNGVKVPLAGARRILSSRENTLRSRLQCPSTAAWYFPDNCKAV